MNCIFPFIFFFSLIYHSQIIWTESFSNGCGSGCLASSYGGWTEFATGTNGAAANNWYVSGAECGNSPTLCGSSCGSTDPSMHVGAALPGSQCAACLICPSGDCGAAYDASGSGFCTLLCGTSNVTTNKRMQSPAINCSGFSNIRVRFNFIHFGQPGSDEARFDYFDGTTWTPLGIFPQTNTTTCSGQGLWTSYDIALPASANNNPNVRIGFNWRNNADGTGYDPSFAVDDIEVYVKPTYCYEQSILPYTTAGCTGSCVMTEFAGPGPFCNGTASSCGSCPASGPTMSLNFSIPAGCTASLTASFERRCNGIGCSNCTFTCNALTSSYGCCNSGLDANDYVRIIGSNPPTAISGTNLSTFYTTGCSANPSTTITIAGNTITATGNNNGGARIFYSQTGGNLTLVAQANRNDEIITYTLTVPPPCNCSDITLPLHILSFWAEFNQGQKKINWLVKNERKIKEYQLFVSNDGINFEFLKSIPSDNISNASQIYSCIDHSNKFGNLYYKLMVINQNNQIEKSLLKEILIQQQIVPIHALFDENDNLILKIHNYEFPTFVSIFSPDARLLYQSELNLIHNNVAIPGHILKHGLYLLYVSTPQGTQILKIIK